ncbi:hypothetical protein JL721_403 [Aureococcus anophagefferens]|nr:hypothetical protein JL721_403 [Aureococcus anophagefferens]
MRAGDWRGFLEDAGVLGTDGPRALGELKADLIFTSLARDADGDDARAGKVLGYGQFRQAMRQAAVALYPQLPEADALKLLGQKHIFPKATLAPEAAARQAGVLAGGGPGRAPRLLDVLRRDGGVPRGGAALAASQHALRAARDAAGETMGEVTRNVDNGFAFLDLFIEVATFCSVGLKGAGGFAWGTVRRCEFDPRGCAPPETAGQARRTRLSRLASLPLMTLDSVDASQAFWVCAGLCLITPPYLLRAVRQARAQTVGLGPGGAKLKLFSLPWCYFQGIKVFAAGLAPVMTTLFSALVCDTCEPSPRFLSRIAVRCAVRCASRTHAVYVAAALAGILCYYPLLTYVQPQLQFKSKALDLKFEPTYLTVWEIKQ